MVSRFHGVFPAMLTPMTPAEDVDFAKLEALVEYLIAAGVHGLIPLGSTGEFYALNPQERHDVLQTVVQAAAGRVPVVAGVNAGATREVVRLQPRGRGPGGRRRAASPRPIIRCRGPTNCWNTSRLVDRAIGIPIMLYNYPGRTGVDMKPDDLERLAELKNVRYVKESTGETARISEIIRRCGDRLQVFCGCDCGGAGEFRPGRRSAGWRELPMSRGGARPLVRIAAVPGLCGRPRIFLSACNRFLR